MIVQVHQKGSGFRGALEYVMEPEKNPRVIDGTVAGRVASEMCHEFEALRLLRPDLTRPVLHFSLSAAPGESLSDKQWIRAVEVALKKLGVADAAYVVVRHYDADHDHVHVIVSRVTVYSKLIPDSHDALMAQEAGRAIEQELGLKPVHSSWERDVERAPRGLTKAQAAVWDRTGVEPFLKEVRKAAINDVQKATSWGNLKERLASHGLSLRPRNGGFVITDGTDYVAISTVDRGSSQPKLTKKFGITYEEFQRTRRRNPDVTLQAETSHDRTGAEGPGRWDTAGGDRVADRHAPERDTRVGELSQDNLGGEDSMGQNADQAGAGSLSDRLDQHADLANVGTHGSSGRPNGGARLEDSQVDLRVLIQRLDVLEQRLVLDQKIKGLVKQIDRAREAKPRLVGHERTLRYGPDRVLVLKEEFKGLGMSINEANELQKKMTEATSNVWDLLLKRPGLEPAVQERLLSLMTRLQGRQGPRLTKGGPGL